MDERAFGELPASELRHFGVKGMKWGVRHRVGSDGRVVPVTLSQKPGKFVKTEGGHNSPASEDALRIAPLRQKAKKSSTDALSNKELQDLVNRMNLEQQYQRLAANDPRMGAGAKIAKDIVNSVGKQQLTKIANESATKLTKK